MLEHLPASLGHVLRAVRPGLGKIVLHDPDVAAGVRPLGVYSPAFGDGEPLPASYTGDGGRLSPPIEWRGVPAAARSVVVVIEDADSPTPRPLVHAILWNLPGEDGGLGEGVLNALETTDATDLGRNSLLRHGYFPPDPPPGHGPHRYAIQVFALDCIPDFEDAPGRGKLLGLLRRHAIAGGLLLATCERRAPVRALRRAPHRGIL